MSETRPAGDSRLERILAFMIAAIVGLSVLAILVNLILAATGFGGSATGFWPVVIVLPFIGLPIGLVLVIVLLVVNIVRRRRESADDAAPKQPKRR